MVNQFTGPPSHNYVIFEFRRQNFVVFIMYCVTTLNTVSSTYFVLGPRPSEVELELDDIKLLRIATLLHPDHLMELSANLVGNVQFLRKIEQQYRGFSPSDYAFMILHDWKKSIKNKRETPTCAMLLDVFEDLQIDKHHLCQVYHITYLLLLTCTNLFFHL